MAKVEKKRTFLININILIIKVFFNYRIIYNKIININKAINKKEAIMCTNIQSLPREIQASILFSMDGNPGNLNIMDVTLQYVI